MTGQRILLIVGDFGDGDEIMVPFQALRAVGHEVHAVYPEKAAGDGVKTAIRDFCGDQTCPETRGHDFVLTHGFDDVDPADYDALVVPGGRAPEYLRGSDEVLDAVRHFSEADGPVASIRHGPRILPAARRYAPPAVGRSPTTAGVLDGDEITAYPAVRPEVEAAGRSWVDGVTTDGNPVTGEAWPDHPEWIARFRELLGTEVEHGAPAATAARTRRGAP